MRKIILFLLVFCFCLSASSAQVILGVSPSNIEFRNVLRGGYAERTITVSTNSEKPIDIYLEARGDIVKWLNFSENATTSSNKPARIIVSVSPPIDVPNGNYTGIIRVQTSTVGSEPVSGGAVGRTLAVVDLAVKVEIVDMEILSCEARRFSVDSVEKGQNLNFLVSVRNKGNVRIRPSFSVKIWDQEQINIVKTKELAGKEILPTREEMLSFEVETNDLDFGQYWADVEVTECFSSDSLTFDILEEGALRAQGVLTRILTETWAEVDQTIPIYALFENVGEKKVNAKFIGQITREGKIVQVLESLEQEVKVGETTNFTFFFTPKKVGRYIVSGRVFYDKKRTFESSSVINVKAKPFSFKNLILIITYLVILVVIIFLFYKIRKEKRRYEYKFKVSR